MFRKILYVIVISIFIFIISGLFLPGSVHIERSIVIERPASTVFTILNSFNTFTSWSPWAEKDPDAVYEISGPETGVGARLSWKGDPRLVGEGWQEITESIPSASIRLKLDIIQQGKADTHFQISRAGADDTRVTWGFDTNLVEGQGFFGGLLARYFGLFFNQWIGKDYEAGLNNLKIYAESLPATDFSGLEVEVVQVEPMDILYVAAESSRAPGGIAASLASAYQEITTFMSENSIKIYSQPMAITRAWDEEKYEFNAAIPIVAANVEPSGNVQIGKSPSGRAVRVIHKGPYDRMAPSYGKLASYMAAHGLREGRVSWEHYISNPGETAPADIITHIYFLIGDDQQETSRNE